MAIFKYTADTVYEKQSVPIARGSFLESRTGNEASFFCDSTNRFQFWNALNRKGEQNWAKWAVANPKYQKGAYCTSTMVADLKKKNRIFIWRAALLMHINPRPHRGVGGDATPHDFFSNGRRTAVLITLKFCTAYGASFAQLLAKK